ncbi:MAG TPA: tandem-95 repeat protein [Rhizomicrobium sp.]|nr:tandem-95 repeat protein [Rhizomicrobium sp.]
MVAIFSGMGYGLARSSINSLGAQGQLGSADFGLAGSQVFVDAQAGNLVIARNDAVLIGRGLNAGISSSYNSSNGDPFGYGVSHDWETGVTNISAVYGGAVNTAGSYVFRTDWDGSPTGYNWNASLNAYVDTHDGLSANRLTFSSAANTWTWIDGKTGTTEVFDAANGGRIVSRTDASGNQIAYAYTGTQLTRVTTADGEYTQLVWTGANLTQITTHLSDGTTSTGVYYGYDASNRLTTVTNDLSPGDNSIADGKTVVTTYGYDGASDRINSIVESSGGVTTAQLAVAYQLVGSAYYVSSFTQTMASGVTRTTSFGYDTTNHVTTITDGAGGQTKLTTAGYEILQMQLPPATTGAAPQVFTYTYNTDQDVTSMTDPNGNVTTYTYDANDNLLSESDPLGNVTLYTYDASNRLLTATTASPGGALTAGNENIVLATIGDTTTFDPRADVGYAAGTAITITGVSSPAHGTATIVGGGTAVQYTRTGAGTDTFTYTVTDSLGHTATATVTIADTTTGGSAPTASNFSATIAGVGTHLTFDPRAYANDPNGYALTVTAVGTAAHGTVTISGGVVSYTRTSAGSDSFTYTVSNGHGGTATATVTIADSTPANVAPDADDIATVVAGIGTSLTFDPRAYASDVNGYALTVTAVSAAGHGTATIVNGGTAILYTRSSAGTDSFTYTVSDGHGHTATATVTVSDGSAGLDQPPVASNISLHLPTGIGTAVTFDPRAYVSDVNNYPLTITAVSTPTRGTATIAADGKSITYTHTALLNGDSFTYTVSDGHGHTATATISTLPGPNNSQVIVAANDAVASPGVGNSATISPLANDANFLAYGMTITALSTPTHGTATIVNGGTQILYTQTSAGNDSFTYMLSDGHGGVSTATIAVGTPVATQLVTANSDTIIVADPGTSLTFDPRVNDANFFGYGMTIVAVSTPSHGTATITGGGTGIQYTRSSTGADSFTYTISDGHGGTATATVTVSTGIAVPQVVAPRNDSIVVNAVGDIATFNPLANDANLFGYAMTITAVSAGAHGTATIVNGGLGLQYTRTSAGADTITYTVSDGHGTTSTATVTITGTTSGGAAGGAAQSKTERYAYDTHGNLRFAVDGDGEVTQYVYNSYGQQISAVTYTDNFYNLAGLGTSTALPLSTMTSWVATITDLSTTKRIDTTYDFRGNVATVTAYSACNAAGTGLTSQPYTVTTTTYDPMGRPLTRRTSGVSDTETYIYDGLGRVVSATGTDGATTTVAYTDSARTVVSTSPGGLTTTVVYDLAGRAISSTLSGTGLPSSETTTYKYDKVGNLCAVTDPAGNTSYFLYDAAGRKVADIAADGALTEYRYDPDNHLVATIAYATKLTTAQIGSLMTAGVPTDPALSAVRPSATSSDMWSWRIYDKDGRLIEAIDGDGDATVFGYDAFSNLVSTTQYANLIAAATVTSFKTTQPVTLQLPTANAADNVTRAFYDNEGRLIGSLDGNGYLTQTVYDAAGEAIRSTAFTTQTAAGLRATGTFAQLLASAGTSAKDIVTRYFYDDRGLLRFTLDANLRATEYQYDNAGNVTAKIDYATPIASTATYTLAYVQGQVASNPGNRCTWYVYDTATGNLDYLIDAVGAVTQYRYDTLGRVVKTTKFVTPNPVSAVPSQAAMDSWAGTHSVAMKDRVTRAIYNPRGDLAYSVDGEGYVTGYKYDADGRPTQKVLFASVYSVADGATQSSVDGQINWSTAPIATQTAYSYDVDGRVSDSFDGMGTDTRYAYDALGRTTDVTVAYNTTDASTTHYVYDNAGQVLSVTRGSGAPEASTTGYTYDGLGRVLTATDPDGHVTTYTYDATGHVLTARDALGGVTTNTYDAFGNLAKQADPLGNTSYFFYDLLGRLTLTVDPMGFATGRTYTIGGEVATVTRYFSPITGTITIGTPPVPTPNAQDSTTTFTYDLDGRLISQKDAGNYTESYTLDALGNRLTVTNKLGGVVTNTYDRRGLVLSQTLPQVSTRSDGTVEGTTVVNTYTYDARGNRTQMVEASNLAEKRTTNYTYDALGRVTQTSGDAVYTVASNWQTTTTATAPVAKSFYDKRGNLIESDDAMGARTLLYYDDLNRKIAQVDALGTLTTWTYDAAGNVTAQTVYGDAVSLPNNPGGASPSPVNANNYRRTSFAYDADNRLRTTTVASVYTGEYVGTTFTTKTADETTTEIRDADGNIVQQTDARGYSSFAYYDKLGRAIAQVDQSGYLTVYSLDANGNVLVETRYANKLTITPTTATAVSALIANVGTSANDRTTNFTYDLNGNRLSEARLNVAAYRADGLTLTQLATTATIYYAYNGLGEVTRKTEATGDYTAYSYDGMGRQTQIQLAAFTDWTNTSIQTTTSEAYDGLNDLTRTVVYAVNSPSGTVDSAAGSHVTTYSYGAGGRLSSTTDASGFTLNFGYDLDGRMVMTSYTRALSNGTNATEASVVQYDAVGRQAMQSVATQSGTTWSLGDQYQMRYDAYGDVSARGVNGMWQETFSYDADGQLWRTNSSDGTVQLFMYDASGNRTLVIASSGQALGGGYDWSTLTLAQAVSLLTNNGATAIGATDASAQGLIATIGAYDGRGQQTKALAPFRQLSVGPTGVYTTQTLTDAKVYNAFGEVVQETDARGAVTSYTYTTLGKVQSQILPNVSYTLENGQILTGTPTTTYYYDLSGRVVGVKDADGNTSTRTLLANTGYGDQDASVAKEYHPDGGIFTNAYDVFGDLRLATNGDGATESYTYDNMDRLTALAHATRAAGSVGNNTGQAVTLTDNYVYDGLGQRIKHWNSQLGAGVIATTDYDSSGRIVKQVDFLGHATTNSYAWSSSARASGLGNFGGWVETTVNSSGMTSTTTTDIFGHTVAKTDFGGNNYNYTFDLAGNIVSDETKTYTYYNTGLVATADSEYMAHYTTPGNPSEPGTPYNVYYDLQATYAYDANGNRTKETLAEIDTSTLWGEGTTTTSYENATTTWDALNRITSLSDTGYGGQAAVSQTWEYDLASNIRHRSATYYQLNTNGTSSTTLSTQDNWYRYDSMNRVTTVDGELVGARGSGHIDRGVTGTDLTYDADGNRLTAATTIAGNSFSGSTYWGGGTYTYTFQEEKEIYAYTADGYLAQTNVAYGGLSTSTDGSYVAPPAATGAGTLQSTYARDAMGRVLKQTEFDGAGINQVYWKTAVYDADSNVTSDEVWTKRSDGTYDQHDTYGYTAYDFANQTYDGAWMGGAVTHITSTLTKNGSGQPTTDTRYDYYWRDTAIQSDIVYKPDTTKSTTYTTTYLYDQRHMLASATISDGTPRAIAYVENFEGEILSSINSKGPQSRNYFFNGVQMGAISNDGTGNVTYSESIAQQTTAPGSGFYTNGANGPTQSANFGGGFDQINGFNVANTNQTYVVQAGDTLSSISQNVWGDANFWYLIADANGLTGDDELQAGQMLIIPPAIANNANNSSTFQVYDPNAAIGNTSPTHPPKPHGHGGCGVFGQILEIIVAAVVAYFAFPVALGLVGGTTAAASTLGQVMIAGAISGAAGNIVGQGFGLATGIQSKFDWGAVATAAIGGAVGYGLGANTFTGLNGAFGDLPIGSFGVGVLRGVTSSIITQGIGVATGLQSKFDWVGVAASGVSSGVSSAVKANAADLGLGDLGKQGLDFVSGMAGTVAKAATQSLLAGTDFGDNLMKALPSVIGKTIGNLIGDGIKDALFDSAVSQYEEKYNKGDDGEPAYRINSDGTISPLLDANGNPIRVDENVPRDDGGDSASLGRGGATAAANTAPDATGAAAAPTSGGTRASSSGDTTSTVVPKPNPDRAIDNTKEPDGQPIEVVTVWGDPWYDHFSALIDITGITPAMVAKKAKELPFGGPWNDRKTDSIYNRVRTRGAWDIKNLKVVRDAVRRGDIPASLVEEYGNFLYGTAMEAHGYSLAWTLEGAGGYQDVVQGYGKDEGFVRHLEGIWQNISGGMIVMGDNIGSLGAPRSSFDATTAKMTEKGFDWGDNPGDSKEIMNGWLWAQKYHY